MKFLRNIVIVLILATGMNTLPMAHENAEHCYEPNAKKTYGFEFRNLSDEDVLLTLHNNKDELLSSMLIKAGYGLQPKKVPLVRLAVTDFNVKEPSTITIVDANTLKTVGVYYANESGKKVFVYWKDKMLKPQTGLQSVSGLPLSRNIKKVTLVQ